ncbi:MAG: hypothetical protein II227_03775, partial [Clostridia bacterium]|nr:hypothetical protein [Clostridia bacterium]
GSLATFTVPAGKASAAAGHKRENILHLCTKYGIKSVKIIEKSEQIGYNVILDICSINERRGGERPCV